MALPAKARSFLRNLISTQRGEADLEQEVQSHLVLLIEENIRSGMQEKEAQRAARIELGGIEQVKEQVREVQIGNWLRSVISDCRYGARQLRKNPMFTAVTVMMLALGIGANTAVFSILDSVLVRPLPYPKAERLVKADVYEPVDILRLILGESMTLTLLGSSFGLVGAYAVTRVMRSLLFGVTSSDPLTFTSVTLVLYSVALLASYIPARRAMRVNPMVALRDE
jgi:hypothetical protein